MVDYRQFRFRKLFTPEFSHILLLIYWLIYGFFFWLVERGFTGHGLYSHYTPVWCSFDDLIPFNEWFVIPYYIWFAFIVLMLLYSIIFDIRAFRTTMWYVIVTYSFTIIVYIAFPTCQELRPDLEALGRSNILTDIASMLYNFDTNTNVCPSIHVLGAVSVFFGSWNAKHLRSFPVRAIMFVMTVLISLSTVFLKQHSIIDVIAAVAVSAVSVPIVHFAMKKTEHWHNPPIYERSASAAL